MTHTAQKGLTYSNWNFILYHKTIHNEQLWMVLKILFCCMQYIVSVPICITLKNKACAFWTVILPPQDCNQRMNSHGATTLVPPSGWHASPSSPPFVVSHQLLSYSAIDTDNIIPSNKPSQFWLIQLSQFTL